LNPGLDPTLIDFEPILGMQFGNRTISNNQNNLKFESTIDFEELQAHYEWCSDWKSTANKRK